MEKKYGLFLNCKTYKNKDHIIFNYTSDEINEVNFFLDDFIYIVESKLKKKIECIKSNMDLDLDREIVFFRLNIKRKDEKKNPIFLPFIKYNLKPPYDINIITKKYNDATLKWETFLWYVINSDDTVKGKNKYIENKNDEYYLQENDILKIGTYKYIVSKIYIKDRNLTKKEKLINTEPYCINISKCEYCGNATIQLCKCPQFYHINEIKEKIKNNCSVKKNKNVTNYYFNLLYCEKKNKDIEECNKYYSLKYKCKASDLENIELDNINFEEKGEDIILNFFDFEIPEDKDYMILESIEEKIENSNYARKSVHIIELNDDEIKIGRKDYNDVIFSGDNRVSKKHAVIKYDKETRNISIKNLGKLGTLALIYPEKNNFYFTEKPIYFQINQTFFEGNIMTENDYKRNKKNKYSEYPIPKNKNEK